MFVRNDAVLEADESILTNLYDIPEKELKNMHISDILIDKTTRLIVDQWKKITKKSLKKL